MERQQRWNRDGREYVCFERLYSLGRRFPENVGAVGHHQERNRLAGFQWRRREFGLEQDFTRRRWSDRWSVCRKDGLDHAGCPKLELDRREQPEQWGLRLPDD